MQQGVDGGVSAQVAAAGGDGLLGTVQHSAGGVKVAGLKQACYLGKPCVQLRPTGIEPRLPGAGALEVALLRGKLFLRGHGQARCLVGALGRRKPASQQRVEGRLGNSQDRYRQRHNGGIGVNARGHRSIDDNGRLSCGNQHIDQLLARIKPAQAPPQKDGRDSKRRDRRAAQNRTLAHRPSPPAAPPSLYLPASSRAYASAALFSPASIRPRNTPMWFLASWRRRAPRARGKRPQEKRYRERRR